MARSTGRHGTAPGTNPQASGHARGILKIVIADPIAPAGVEIMSERCHVVDASGTSREDLLPRLRDAAALVVRSSTSVDRTLLEAAPELQVVGRAGTGLDNIDLVAAAERGVVVVNTPQANIISAAEHTFALMLALVRNVPRADQQLRSGIWNRQQHQGVELFGKTLGIMGLGRVGSLVATRAQAFGMRIIGHDPYISGGASKRLGVESVSFVDLLKNSDVITVHVPKDDSTVGLFDAEAFIRCKRGVFLVNVSRGGIVDEKALANAISSGHVAGAALDVFADEPTTDSPLFDLPRVVATPHLGASTGEAQQRVGIEVADAIMTTLNISPAADRDRPPSGGFGSAALTR